MKHLLNNLSEEEKNKIREQHTGGMKVNSENFNKLTESKLGNVKPLICENELDEDRIDLSQTYLSPEKMKELISKQKQINADMPEMGSSGTQSKVYIKK